MTTPVLRFPGMPPALPFGEDSLPPQRLTVDAAEWAAGAVGWAAFDEEVDGLARRGAFAVVAEGSSRGVDAAGLRQVASEVEVRCQRWSGRRNEASRGEWFSAVLARHREVHPLDKPLVWADYRHVLDVWQWTLRLDPAAGAALQVAALFHDVERVASEADSRHEQAVDDYDAYKARHGEASARMTAAVLAPLALPDGVRERAVALVAAHDRPEAAGEAGADPEAALLQDADALSFFVVNSAGYWSYYGPEQTRRKVEWTLRRLSPRGAAWLPSLRLRREVAALLAQARSGAAIGWRASRRPASSPSE